jgi:hypothetical protein
MRLLDGVYDYSEDSLEADFDGWLCYSRYWSGIHGVSIFSRIRHAVAGILWHGHAYNWIWARNAHIRFNNQTASETGRSASASSAPCAVKNSDRRVHSLMKTT